MCDFKIIMIVVTGIQPLVQLIIRYTVEKSRSILNISGVIAMNHLTHQPEILFPLSGTAAQFFHKSKIQTIRTVQTNTVNIKIPNPTVDTFQQILFHFRILKIQIHQFKTISPGFIRKSIIIPGISPKPDSLIPVHIPRLLPVLLNILKSEKFPSGMVKHTIHHDSDALFMRLLYKTSKVLFISQASVNHPIISRIISMGRGFKKGTYINSAAPQTPDMGKPFFQLRQPMRYLCLLILSGRSQHTNRIDMIKYRFFKP